MNPTTTSTSKLGSISEDKFIELFYNVFGPENSQYLSPRSIPLWIYIWKPKIHRLCHEI